MSFNYVAINFIDLFFFSEFNMKYYFILFFTLISISILFSQNTNNEMIDTTLSQFEINFQDSINMLNKQNQKITDSRSSYNKGLEFLNNNNISDAILEFNKAIEIDSMFISAYISRGKCFELEKHDLAISDYRKAYLLDASNLDLLYKIGEIQALTDKNRAIQTYDSILDISTNAFRAHYEIAVLLYIQGNIEDAISSFTSSLMLQEDARSFNDRGSCYRKLGEYDKAIDDYLSAINLDSDLAFVYNNLASTYRKQDKTEKALKNYTLAIEIDNNYAMAYNNRGSLYLDLGDNNKSLSDIDKAISLDLEYPPAYNNKGVIFYKKKKYTEAIDYFNKAIELNKNYAKAYLNRGISRQMIRDEDGACSDWEEAYRLGIKLAKKYLKNDCE